MLPESCNTCAILCFAQLSQTSAIPKPNRLGNLFAMKLFIRKEEKNLKDWRKKRKRKKSSAGTFRTERLLWNDKEKPYYEHRYGLESSNWFQLMLTQLVNLERKLLQALFVETNT